MKLNQRLLLAGVAGLMALGVSQSALSQQDNPPAGPPPGGGRGNFDPAQFRQRMMDRLKEQLEVTDDAEWKALEPLIQNVTEARRATMSGMGRGMFGGGPRRGSGDNAGGGGRGPGGNPALKQTRCKRPLTPRRRKQNSKPHLKNSSPRAKQSKPSWKKLRTS